MKKTTIDFDTMRVNCIQIHQETHELFQVAEHVGEDLNLVVETADELKTHPETKTWEGVGRFAKSLYDNKDLWNSMPEYLSIGNKYWEKEKSRAELLNCYQQLGGKNLDIELIKPETDLFGNPK